MSLASLCSDTLGVLSAVEDVSNVISDVPMIGAIGSLVSLVVDKALQAKANKEQCQRLALRVKVVWEALVPLAKLTATNTSASSASHKFVAALEQLETTLVGCRELIALFSDAALWKRWLLSGRHHERFAELTQQLTEDQQALSLGLDVAAFAYREQDKASAQLDMQNLEQLLLDMQREQKRSAQKVCDAIKKQTSSTARQTVAAVERAIDDTASAQVAELKAFIAEQMAQLKQFGASGAPPAVARGDSLAPQSAASLMAPEISPCQVEIDESVAVRVTSDGSGVVFEGRWMSERVSVKRLLPPDGASLTADEQARFRREVHIGSMLRHPRVLALYGAFCDHTGALLVSEPYDLGSLETHAHRGDLPTAKRAQLCEDIAIALAYLHTQLVWHRALRASACVVTADWRAKLSDLARAKSHAADIATAGHLAHDAHEWRWSAPECLMSTTKRGHSGASDMFSFGMLLFEVFVGAEPWAACVADTQATMRVMQQLTDVAKSNQPTPTPPIPDTVPAVARDLMHRCWQRRPGSRPLAGDAVSALRELCSTDQRIATLMDDASKALGADPRHAVVLLERAAALGSLLAHTRLGDLFSGLKATSVPLTDGARATTHYEAAAAAGDKRAAFNLACLFREGKLVQKDVAKAKAAFERAAALGNDQAKAELAKL
jgi:serine/threonine protein kinase